MDDLEKFIREEISYSAEKIHVLHSLENDYSSEINLLVSRIMEKYRAVHKQENDRILFALAEMYSQYCPGKYGHHFMSAGESAIEVLEDYGLATEQDGVDEEALDRYWKSL